MGIFLGSSRFGTIFFRTHILWHHLNSHRITPQIRWLLVTFPQRLQVRLRLQTFFWFLQVSISTHVALIRKWSFWNGFWTPLGLFSPWRFNKWIPSIVSICFHITHGHIPPQITCVLGVAHLLTITKPKDGIHPITVGEALYRFTSYVKPLILWSFCNTFFPTPIWSYN